MKHKIILILIILTCWNITAKAQFGGGDGTETSPYEIYTKAHLEELADSVNNSDPYPADNWSKNKFFKVMNDINEPITKMIGFFDVWYKKDHRFFCGNFDGNNFKIKLNINNTVSSLDSYNTGLFSCIRNATITNLVVDGKVKGKGNVGAIVGDADSSTIFNCVNLAKVEGEYNFVGGIVGTIFRNCIISYCLNIETVKGGFCIGGIVGHAGLDDYDGTNNNIISHSKNTGYVSGYNAVSGIVGHLGNYNDNSNTIIINCINVGITKLLGYGGNMNGIGYIDPPEEGH